MLRTRTTGKVNRALSLLLGVLLLAGLGYIIYKRSGLEAGAPASLVTELKPSSAAENPDEPMPKPQAAQQEAPSQNTREDEPWASGPDIDISSWEYALVNKENLLESTYAPELSELENGQYFDSRAVDALKDFIEAARAEGFSVCLSSAYRPYSVQESLFKSKVREVQSWYGLDEESAALKAKTIVAYPGTSEHQLGLACDITDRYYAYMNESLAETELLKWMAENCAAFGFILRYPEDKQELTGVMYEPWHFRYVGKEAAGYITENGLCLEEFVAFYKP